MLDDASTLNAHVQVAGIRHAHRLGAGDGKADVIRVGARPDDVHELHAVLVGVNRQVDARIDVGVFYAGVGGQVWQELARVAGEMMDAVDGVAQVRHGISTALALACGVVRLTTGQRPVPALEVVRMVDGVGPGVLVGFGGARVRRGGALPSPPPGLYTHHLHADRDFGFQLAPIDLAIATGVVPEIGAFFDMDLRAAQVQAHRARVQNNLESCALSTEVEGAPVILAVLFEQHGGLIEGRFGLTGFVLAWILELDRGAFGWALRGNLGFEFSFAPAGPRPHRFAGRCR